MKKFLSLCLCMVLLLSLIACGNGSSTDGENSGSAATNEPEVAFDVSEYKSLVRECSDAISESAIILSNVGQYEHNYWKALNSVDGTIDYDSMVIKAKEWLAKNSDADVESEYESICDMYGEIAKIDVSGSEAEEIDENIGELFSSYVAMYSLVTSPSGDISDFANNFNSYTKSIQNRIDVLTVLLDDAE